MSLDIDTLRRRLQKALGKEFTVGALLGEGGFAAVFRVRDKEQERDVAVKVLDLGVTRSAELAERFVREARTVAQLQHPHIVPIYKVGGYKNEVLYIVMRCLDGPSLRHVLEKYPRLSVGDAGRIARQVADALGHAHRLGVVHRDIKPDNILFDASGHVLVTDFGIAKAVEEVSASPLTTEGMVVGTPQYMSPEQATGERVDARADIYALGIVLYQMLAGAPPFDGESAQAILMKQATVAPPPVRRARRDVPPALAAVVERMLAKDPADRFQTAEEASAALVRALPAAAQETVRVRPRAASVVLRALAGLVFACATFLIAAGVVAYAVVSARPRLLAGAPAPDSVVRRLRRDGALAADDAAEFVFVPGGGEDSTLLLVSRRRVAVVTPGRVRSYPRDSVRVSYGMALGRGVAFRLVLAVPGMRPDTAFRRLSLRDVYDAGSRLRRLLSGPGAATRRTR